MSGTIITTSSWKGGTGKTTLNVLAAEILANRGSKVLIIDLDSNCSISLVYNSLFKDRTAKDLITGSASVSYQVKENIEIIPGDLQIGQLNNIMDSQLKVNIRKYGLSDLYDFIIIDPPGYWGAHTRNAVFASDILVVPGTCSKLDLKASQNYFSMLEQCAVDTDTFAAVNAFNRKTNEPGVYEEYKKYFGGFLIPFPVPFIQSLKKLTGIDNYKLHPSVRVRLEKYVDYITGGTNA